MYRRVMTLLAVIIRSWGQVLRLPPQSRLGYAQASKFQFQFQVLRQSLV